MKVIASIIFSASSFISLIFMTRYVGEAYGMMMWGMSMVAMVNTALDMGFHSANIKKVSEGKDISRCVSTYLAVRIAISSLMALIVLTISLALSYYSDGFPSEFWMVTWVFILYYVLDNILVVMTGTFIGNMDAGKESIVLTTEYLLRSVSLMIFSVMGSTAVVLSFGYIIGVVCALAVSLFLFRSLKVRLVRPAFFKEYVSFVVPLALPVMLIAVMGYIDKFMIGTYHNELEVGFYAAAAGVIYSFVTLGVVMNGLLLSHMTKLNKEGKRDEARNTLWSAQKYLAVLMLPATAFLLIFGNETAVALFKDGFADSGPVLSVLAVGIFLTVLAGMLAQVLLSAGHNVVFGRSAIVYTVFTIALFFVLIPGYFFDDIGGAVGAALAVVIGSALYLTLLSISAKRKGLFSIYPRLYIHLAAAGIVLAILYCVKEHLSPSGLIPLILLAFLTLALYAVILAIVKEITKDDIRFVRDTLSPKNIYDDLVDEMRKS